MIMIMIMITVWQNESLLYSVGLSHITNTVHKKNLTRQVDSVTFNRCTCCRSL